MELHFFDPRSEYTVIERRLPHWTQAGVICFITFRTHDSIPKDVLERWRQERRQWLRQHGINPIAADWRVRLQQLNKLLQHEFYEQFSTRWHDELDACHGACVLRDRSLVNEVGNSLRHFDGERYELTDFVVMPNHVHLLAAFADEPSMLAQCESWKQYTARKINRELGDSGRFWQRDGFDHMVRSEEQFLHFRNYIARNGEKAGLAAAEYLHYSHEM